MTEADWLTCDNLQAMLAHLFRWEGSLMARVGASGPSADKLRTFAEAAGCPKCAGAAAHLPAAEYALYVAGAACGSRAAKAALLRCVFRNPSRPWADYSRCHQCGAWFVPPKLRFYRCPNCKSEGSFSRSRLPTPWLTPAGMGLATTARDGQDFALLPVLADALEDAGCNTADLLAHLRGPGPHCRGCWPLEVVLGRG